MPRHYSSRGDQHERLFPSRRKSSQSDPEELVHGWDSATRAFHLQSEQLLAKSQVLENEILAAVERTHD
jgi:hypothetical protein